MEYKIYNDDCLKVLEKIENNFVDSIITDPPYGLTSIVKRFGKDGSFAILSKGFMGKEWDGSGIEYNVDMWGECLRVLKPRWIFISFWWHKDLP